MRIAVLTRDIILMNSSPLPSISAQYRHSTSLAERAFCNVRRGRWHWHQTSSHQQQFQNPVGPLSQQHHRQPSKLLESNFFWQSIQSISEFFPKRNNIAVTLHCTRNFCTLLTQSSVAEAVANCVSCHVLQGAADHLNCRQQINLYFVIYQRIAPDALFHGSAGVQCCGPEVRCSPLRSALVGVWWSIARAESSIYPTIFVVENAFYVHNGRRILNVHYKE